MRHAFGWCRRRRDQCLDVVLWCVRHRCCSFFAEGTAGLSESCVSNLARCEWAVCSAVRLAAPTARECAPLPGACVRQRRSTQAALARRKCYACGPAPLAELAACNTLATARNFACQCVAPLNDGYLSSTVRSSTPQANTCCTASKTRERTAPSKIRASQ